MCKHVFLVLERIYRNFSLIEHVHVGPLVSCELAHAIVRDHDVPCLAISIVQI